MKQPPPDFAIVGAPKCGTTSVHSALRKHPQLFLPSMKEPHYFAYDYPRRREVTKLASYDRLFEAAKPTQLRGESSALYLSSDAAIPALIRRNPDIKIIAFVRNPIELFVSLHNEFVKTLDEDQTDPEEAWIIQGARAGGKHVPSSCKVPALLQYRSTCSLGRQIERLCTLLPAEQRLVIVFDDLKSNPTAVLRQITGFLAVTGIGDFKLVHENGFAQFKSRFVARLAQLSIVNPLIRELRSRTKPLLNDVGLHPIGWMIGKNLKPIPKPVLRPAFREELEHAFRADVELTEQLLGRDLSHWCAQHDGLQMSSAASL